MSVSVSLSYGLYYLVGLMIALPIARVGVAGWDLLAATTNAIPPLPTSTDIASAATLAGVIAWLLGKTIPMISTDHKESMKGQAIAIEAMGKRLSEAMDGVQAEVKRGNDAQLALLRSVVARTKREDEP